MITLYNPNATKEEVLNTNGLGIVNALTAYVEETLNGDHLFTFTISSNDSRAKEINKYNILRVNSVEGYDVFRVSKIRKDLDLIECICKHITYDLEKNFVEDVHIVNNSGAAALNQILSNTQFNHSFTNYSDIAATSTLYLVRKNILAAILATNEDNTFINRFGGEVKRNQYEFSMLTKRGSNRGFKISYGKNLKGIEENIEEEEITRIMPLGRKGENANVVLMLPEKYIDSPLIANYPSPSVAILDLPDLRVDDQNTEEAIILKMREAVHKQFNDLRVDRPKVNFKVDFIELSKSNQYKDLKILEQIFLGDIVSINSLKLNIDIEARLIKYKYDCLQEKYVELEIGDYSKSEYSILNKLEDKITKKNKVEIDILKIAQTEASNLIKGALGGYVVKRENELLIMDTDNIATAKKVWRWNQNGLGYSSTGYNGTYGLAMTIDGHIVADFITSGVINANLIKAGTLSSLNGNTWINMKDGTFNFGDKISFDGSSFHIDLSQATIPVPEIEVGGRNLILGSDFLITTGEHYFGYAINNNYIKNQNVALSVDIDLNSVNSTEITGGRVGSEVAVTYSDGTKDYFGAWKNIQYGFIYNDKIRIKYVGKVQDKDISNIAIGIYIQKLNQGTAKVSKPKFELGTLCTDWTPAPEDLNATTTALSTKIEANATQIALKANQTDFNALGNKVTSAEAAITVNANNIANKVNRSDFDSLGNRVSTTESKISQTENEWKAAFEYSGASNIIPNPRPFRNTPQPLKGWNPWVGRLEMGSGTENDNGRTVDYGFWWRNDDGNQANKILSIDLNGYKFDVHKKYSIAINIYSQHNRQVLFQISNDNSSHIVGNHRDSLNGDNFKVIASTFTPSEVGATPVFMIVDEGSGQNNFYIEWAVIVQSEIAPKVYVPNDSTFHEGHTSIDRDGVHITNGALFVTNANGETIIDGSHHTFGNISWHNGNIVLRAGDKSATAEVTHNLGYTPPFVAQWLGTDGAAMSDPRIDYDNDSGELVSRCFCWADTQKVYLQIRRIHPLTGSDTWTMYYRLWIQDDGNKY